MFSRVGIFPRRATYPEMSAQRHHVLRPVRLQYEWGVVYASRLLDFEHACF